MLLNASIARPCLIHAVELTGVIFAIPCVCVTLVIPWGIGYCSYSGVIVIEELVTR